LKFQMHFMIIFELAFKQKWVKRCKKFKYYHEMRLKLNKIWLKGLYPYIFRDEVLNWSKISKRNQFQNSLKT